MNPLRVALITRRFWPLVGGAERIMASLGAELAARGAGVTLLTARWQPHWPAEIAFRGFPVVRFPQPSQRFWGTLEYMRSLGRWLRENRDRYDLVYVSMLKHDAFAALRAIGRDVPVVLRAEGAGPGGDCRWQAEDRFGCWIRRRCRRASAVVAPSAAIEEDLLAAGYRRDRVHAISNGVPIPPPPSPARRAEARAVLSAASPLLRLDPETPLAVYTGRLDRAKGLTDLVAAWEGLAARRPQARLWLVGEGPFRQELDEQIHARALTGRVVLAGVFDSVDEILAAADTFVLPSEEEGMSLSLLEAMAAGVPVIVSDIAGNRRLVEHERQGLLVPLHAVNVLRSAIERVWDEPGLALQLGAAARQRVQSHFSLAKMADEHLRLFETLLARTR